jgi:hypothetical protein
MKSGMPARSQDSQDSQDEPGRAFPHEFGTLRGRCIQKSGECWMGATTWHGQRLMRISVSSWRTTEADVDRSVTAILAAQHRGRST